MATDKERLIKGLYHMAAAFPFIFAGPSLYFSKGAAGFKSGDYTWTILSIVLMLAAVFLVVRGLRISIKAFFEGESGSDFQN
jgi:hypothetical protein